MNLPCDNVHEAAKHLRNSNFQGFSLLPYSRFDSTRSQFWWILPEGVNPAYHLGKIELALDDANPDSVFIGFSVEKGFGADVTGKKSEVMQPNWFWHDFVRLCNLPLAGAIEQANEAVGDGMQIHVGSGMPNSKSSNARVVFGTQGGRLSQLDDKPGDGLLAALAGSDSFAAFADGIRALDGPPGQWHWMGVMIGTAFTLDPDGEDNTDRCAAMLQPFRPWLRAARSG